MAGAESDAASIPKSYRVGDVGDGARVIVGDNNSWVERVDALPGGQQVAREIAALIGNLKADSSLSDDDQELAVEKMQAVASALPEAAQSPDRLRKALRDASQFLGATVAWAWQRLQKILTSDAGRAVLGTIADSAAKAAISGLLGVPVL